MKYNARVSRRIRNVRVYAVVKRVGAQQNALTSLFERIFNPKGTAPKPGAS